MNKEQIIGAATKSYFEAAGFSCWGEVSNRGKVADLVCFKEPIYIVVECKQALTISVLEQADFWIRSGAAHFVYISVPKSKTSRYFAYRLCNNYGIGLLEVGIKNHCDPRNMTIKEKSRPKFWRKAKPTWKLFDEQKESIPGTFGGGNFTPWKNSIKLLKEHVALFGPTKIDDVVKKVNHHWSTNSVAKRCIIIQIQRRIIKDLGIKDGVIFLKSELRL